MVAHSINVHGCREDYPGHWADYDESARRRNSIKDDSWVMAKGSRVDWDYVKLSGKSQEDNNKSKDSSHKSESGSEKNEGKEGPSRGSRGENCWKWNRGKDCAGSACRREHV